MIFPVNYPSLQNHLGSELLRLLSVSASRSSSLFKNLRIKKEVINVYSQDTIVIIIGLYNIFCYDNLFERIINFSERSDFLSAFRFIRQRICRLDVVSGRTKIAYKIDFKLFADNLTIMISIPSKKLRAVKDNV